MVEGVTGQGINKSFVRHFPEKIRVSVGSAVVLGLLEGKLDAEPTTAYLMTYKIGKCTANCGFCPQARSSQSKAELLSRVKWPVFSTTEVLTKIEHAVSNEKIRRVCVQALNYPGVFRDICAFVERLKQQVLVQVSVSCQPLNSHNLGLLSEAGVDRIGIALDAATEKLFNYIKGTAAGGPYKWKDQLKMLQVATRVFGEGNVSTHLIAGLGETEKEAVRIIQECVDMSVLPALFAFTPIHGTALENNPQPRVESYRRIQLARYLIVNGTARYESMRFDGDGRTTDFSVEKETLKRTVETGKPFLTSGCPNCNRPFYNEKPSGPIYNYPRNIRPEETVAIKQQLRLEPRF